MIYGDDLELLKDQIDSGAHNVALEGSAQHEFLTFCANNFEIGSSNV